MHTNTTVALKHNFMSSLLLCADFFKYANSSTSLKKFNLHNKDPKDLLSSSLYTMLKQSKSSKTTYPQKLFPSECIRKYVYKTIYQQTT